MNQTMKATGIAGIYKKLQKVPMGKQLFTRSVSFKAPYFKSINPLIADLRPGYCEVTVKNRKAIHNHIATVHAIAMANMCELAMGMAVEAACPKSMRWIPKGMQIDYLKKAKTDLKAVCDLEGLDLSQPQDISPEVNIYDTEGDVVSRATITVKVSPK